MEKEIEFLETISTLVWNDISKQELVEMLEERKQALKKQLTIPVVVRSKTKPKRTLGDFDVWYKPCTRCGYDTGKSTKPKDGNKTCWKCGNFVQRDYTDRALKK
jgi:hypothetical protein